MPTYEYACRGCGRSLEVVQSFSDDPLTTCESCGGELRKVFSAAGLIFKGSGWHIKDYAGSGRSSSGGGTASGSDGGSSSTPAKDGTSSSPAKDGASSTSTGTSSGTSGSTGAASSTGSTTSSGD